MKLALCLCYYFMASLFVPSKALFVQQTTRRLAYSTMPSTRRQQLLHASAEHGLSTINSNVESTSTAEKVVVNPYKRQTKLDKADDVSAKKQKVGNTKNKATVTAAPSAFLVYHSPRTLADILGGKPTFLTKDEKSWFIHVRNYYPCKDDDEFNKEWNLHPTERHPLKVYGRVVYEKRWSQQWGRSFKYSGNTNVARPISENQRVADLIDHINNNVYKKWVEESSNEQDSVDTTADIDTTPYNCCLQNWYTPADTIGLHSDDEKAHVPNLPIFSYTWGGPRRFLLRPRDKVANPDTIELILKSGDLLAMGGTCQDTHRHEVPKMRVKDPLATNRINWTIRAFKE